MPCTKQTFNCKIYNAYIGTGNPYYRGELCLGCLWWEPPGRPLSFPHEQNSVAVGRDRNRTEPKMPAGAIQA